MGRYISGTFTCKITFEDLYIEDGQSEIDALFPGNEGWEGFMEDEKWDITNEEHDED